MDRFVSLYIALHHGGGLVRHWILGRTSVQCPNMGASLLKANLSHIVGQQAFLIKTSNTMSDNFLLFGHDDHVFIMIIVTISMIIMVAVIILR